MSGANPSHVPGPAASITAADEAATAGRYRATGRYRRWLVSSVQWTFSRVFRFLFHMEVQGQDRVPREGGVILAGNHTGFLDGPLVFLYTPRPTRFLTKAEIYGHPLLARALGWLGQIPVHRGQPDRPALREALAVLAAGGAVGVFPEGTRSAGTLSAMHDGVAYLAVKSGCPVVPVACFGSAAALPKGSRLPRLRAQLVVSYGSPVTVTLSGSPQSRHTVAAAAADIRHAMRAHLAETAARSARPVEQSREESA